MGEKDITLYRIRYFKYNKGTILERVLIAPIMITDNILVTINDIDLSVKFLPDESYIRTVVDNYKYKNIINSVKLVG